MQRSTADEYGTKILDLLYYMNVERGKIIAIVIASVVPQLNGVFQELAKKYFQLNSLFVGDNLKSSLPILYDHPKEVGADRIVNAIAVYAKMGGPAIVVDYGTATTFDCVTRKGEYAGGLIVPGPLLASESLSRHTAKLPRVELAKPKHLIGKSTVESIQSGLYYGYICLVDGLLTKLKAELGKGAKIAATGGLAQIMAVDSKWIRKENILPELTLEGLMILYEKNMFLAGGVTHG